MSLSYTAVISKDKNDIEWDDFVASVPGAHFEQTTGWAVANEMRGWTTWRFYLKSGNVIAAGFQVAFLSYPLAGKIGLVTQGPVARNEDEELLHVLIEETKLFLKENGFLYVAFVVPYKQEKTAKILKTEGLSVRPFGLPPTAVVEDTLFLDLKKEKQELWRDISQSRRRNIKKGLKQNFNFHEGSRDDLKTFHHLMLTMCDRRNTEPTHKNVEFFYRLWDNLAAQGWFKLFLLEYENSVTCALVGFSIGDTFRYWKWGWNGDHQEMNFPSVMIWKTIEWAKDNGFRYFDFVQVDREVAEAVKGHKQLTDDLLNKSFAGPTLFKVRYGGELVSTPGIYIMFRNAFVRTLIMNVVVKLLNSKLLTKLMGFVRHLSIR